MQDWTGTQLIARLVAAAKLSQTAFRERGLDVHYDRQQLVSAAVSAACAPASSTPITSVSTSTKAIALSFDDGPSPFTPQVLDVLRHYRAHATFFVLGENLTDRSRVLGRMLVSGNEIANGTWTGAHASYDRRERARERAAPHRRRDRVRRAVPAVPHPAAVPRERRAADRPSRAGST